MNANIYNYDIDNAEQKQQHWLNFGSKKKRQLEREDVFILATLEKLKKDLDNIHLSLDAVTDPDLIDSFIYEMNAINMRYKVYLNICKEKGLISAMF